MAEHSDEATYKQIILDSEQKLSALSSLSVFFNYPVLVAITVRTQVIHELFSNNQQLDIHKLDLFHLQYTKSLTDLLVKLRKSKEQRYRVLDDEIRINAAFIAKLSAEVDAIPFAEEQKQHASNMAKALETLCHYFKGNAQQIFDWSPVTRFINRRSGEFYRQISIEQYQRLSEHSEKSVFQNSYVTFEKKLYAILSQGNFRVRLICGLRYDAEELEVYELPESGDKFIFINDEKSFYLVDQSSLAGIDLSENRSSKMEAIDRLMRKNELLNDQLSAARS